MTETSPQSKSIPEPTQANTVSVNAGDDVTVGGDIVGRDKAIAQTAGQDIIGRDKIEAGTYIAGDVIFQLFAQATLARHIRVHEFQTLVNERTRNFVGREFISKAIDRLLQDPNFPSGYIVIRGEPGIGKTSLILDFGLFRPRSRACP